MMETPVPAPVVTLCILNIFFQSYFQRLHYKSYITSCWNRGWDPGVSAPQWMFLPQGCGITLIPSPLFTTDIFYLFIQNETDSSRFARLTKYSVDGNSKHCWRMRGICCPALHTLWLGILGSCSMCSPHASGTEFLRQYRWRNCAWKSCQAWIRHREFSSADTARLLNNPRNETLAPGFTLEAEDCRGSWRILDAGTVRKTIFENPTKCLFASSDTYLTTIIWFSVNLRTCVFWILKLCITLFFTLKENS